MRNGNLYIYIISLIFFVLTFNLSAQNNFNRIYGGPGGEEAYSVRQTFDGAYIFTGYTTSYGAGYRDIWLVKITPAGDTLWTKSYGFDLVEESYSAKQMPDSGFIVLGKSTTSSQGLYNDFWLLRTDQLGDTLWTKFYGDLWEQETPQDIIITNDGGFAIVGFDQDYIKNGSIWFIKTNSTGDTSWTKKYGGPYGESASCIIQTSDNGYLIGGRIAKSSRLSDNDLLLIKTDVAGETTWTRTFGKRNSDGAASILETQDGGYLIAGTTDHYYNGFSYDVWLLKVSTNGDSLWSKYYGGYDDESSNSIHPTKDGGYVICASVSSSSRENDGHLLIKIDSQGDTLWTRRFGAESNDWASDGFPTEDGGFILCGYTNSYGALLRDAWLIKTDASGYVTALHSPEPNIPLQSQLYQNYPNPFNPSTKIGFSIPKKDFVNLKVYDVLGREIATLFEGQKEQGVYEVSFNAKNLTSGLYIYRLQSADFTSTKKMLLIK